MKCKPGRHTAAFILLFLTKEPSYGFELLKKFESDIPCNLIDSAAVYRSLKMLESIGAVEFKWDTHEPGAAKKIYSITDVGYVELDEFKADIELRYNNFVFFLNEYRSIKESDKGKVEVQKK